MKLFDLSAALAWHPVCTRDGLKVEQLTLFKSRDVHCLMGVVDERVYAWNKDGNGCQLSMTLHMAPVKKTGWVARYKEGGVCGTFATEEQARATCGNRTVTYHKIEWEEEE